VSDPDNRCRLRGKRERAAYRRPPSIVDSATPWTALNRLIVVCPHRAKGYESDSEDYEFSRRSMEEHWRTGYCDAVHALRHPEIFERSSSRYERLVTFDTARMVENFVEGERIAAHMRGRPTASARPRPITWLATPRHVAETDCMPDGAVAANRSAGWIPC
jgi:Patatin phospholipase